MALGPLRQPPFLDDQGRPFELDIFSFDITVEDGEFPADMRTFELLRGRACECRDALRVRKRRVELLRGSAEFVRGSDGLCVDGSFTGGCRRSRGFRGWCLCFQGLSFLGWSAGPARRVGARGMLKILPVFLDQGRSKCSQLFPELRNYL